MSITIRDLSHHYSGQFPLFNRLSFSIEDKDKVSIVGNNGVGKSTLLKLMSGQLSPIDGNIISSSLPYYISQHTGRLDQSIAEALDVKEKLSALDAIMKGSISQSDYDTLGDDWEIESRCMSALTYWKLSHIKLNMQMDNLSGGEKTKVFLAGLLIHSPEIILLDEPTNHLDQTSRDLLYQYIVQSKATIVVVSHDITLLDQLQITYELSEHGIRLYGGNYSFYNEQKEIEQNALTDSIHEQEKTLRLARKQAQEVKQRQEKRTSQQGEKNKMQVPRIMRNTLRDSAENTASRLKDKHAEIIQSSQSKLSELRQQKERLKELKLDFDNTSLHSGKLLIEAKQINFGYHPDTMLWTSPLDLKLFSNDRIHLQGDNGSGKTTLIQLLTGTLTPSCGEVKCANNLNWIYLDQNYSQVDEDCTIEQLAEKYNLKQMEEHEVKLRLNRFLFPSDSWYKNCRELSGGEKMRLYLCCQMISNQTPDLIILDEPTNNLDISSLRILTQTMKNYQGSLLVISHDQYFVKEIGTTFEWKMES